MTRIDGEALRRRIAECGPRARGRWIHPELRDQALRYGRQSLAEGRSQAEVARELDVSVQSLRNWGRRDAFVEVAVEEAAETTRFVVTGPAGLSIHGLTIEELAQLLRSLS